ncbi:hypothetical protein FYK55_06350 [Roseiconus nitratireducens]|uniref:NIPSNAP domain-containing protein n=2 Tax=Roseiconus nitratireducens TaxID=2605748 RepID=A0A5M6DJW3_9BACT|nr:hypothetical protein FYK55_06350 [Roseiconus nitratireducens]
MDKQYYEVRTYQLKDASSAKALDAYLRDALLPALGRQDVGPVGVFAPAEPTEKDSSEDSRVIVVIPYDSPNDLVRVASGLRDDSQFQQDARESIGIEPDQVPYKRIRSELLVAMDCMPKLNVPAGTLENQQRVYELRLYESPNERLGDLKVDMFNNGEVPIFLDSGIQPVFLGQCLIGPQTPCLIYLTVYPDDAARQKAWDTFRNHPDWQVLKGVEKYKGTVSRIDQDVLAAKPYSQM